MTTVTIPLDQPKPKRNLGVWLDKRHWHHKPVICEIIGRSETHRNRLIIVVMKMMQGGRIGFLVKTVDGRNVEPITPEYLAHLRERRNAKSNH